MVENIIELGVDEGDAPEKLADVGRHLKELTDYIIEFTGVTEKYNPEGIVTQRVFRGLTDTLGKATATFRNTADGLILIGQSSDQATSRLKQLEAISRALDTQVLTDAKQRVAEQIAVERGLDNAVLTEAKQRASEQVAIERGMDTAILTEAKQRAGEQVALERGMDAAVLTEAKQRAAEQVSLERGLDSQILVAARQRAAEQVALERGLDTAVLSEARQRASEQIAVERGMDAAVLVAARQRAAEQVALERGLDSAVLTEAKQRVAEQVALERGLDSQVLIAARQRAAEQVALERGLDAAVLNEARQRAAGQVQIERGMDTAILNEARQRAAQILAEERALDDAILREARQQGARLLAEERARDSARASLNRQRSAALLAQFRRDDAEQARIAGTARANTAAGQANTAFAPEIAAARAAGNVRALNGFNSAMNVAFNLLTRNRIAADQFTTILNNVRAGNIQTNLVGPLNQAQSAIIRATAAITNLGNQGNVAGSRILSSFQGIVSIFSGQLLYRGFSLLTQGILESVKASAEYARQIALVQTISQDAGVTFDSWHKSIRRVADAFGTDAIQAATASYDLLSNQVTRGAETTQILSQALAFGRTTNASATDSVNLFSSAINSFDLKASDADRVARTFFATIDRGRITASELANSFGRSGTLANSLGVNLEELQAGISTLTRQGIKGNEAYTLLNNLFLKLLKPTKELQAFLNKLGFETGQDAIAALGFTGVLEALDKEFDGNTAKVARFFNQIRGGRAALNLTGQGLKDFKQDLEEITNSSGAFNAAKGIVENNFGQQFIDEGVKIKNFFTVDIGEKIASSLVNLKENLGGFVPIVKKIVEVFKLATVATAAFITTSTFGAIIASLLYYQVTIGLVRTAWQAATAAAAAHNVAAAFGVGGVVVAASVLVGAITAAVIAWNDYGHAAEEAYDDAIAASEDAAQKIQDVEKAAGDKRNIELIKGLEAGKQAFLKYAADVKLSYEDLADSILETQKEITEGIKDSISRLTGILDNSVHEIEHKAKEAADNVDKAEKERKALPSKTAEDISDNNLKRAEKLGDIGAQQRILNEQILIYRERSRAAFATGDIDAGNKAYEKTVALVTKLSGLVDRVPIFGTRPGAKTGHVNALFDQRDENGKPIQVPVRGPDRQVRTGTAVVPRIGLGTLNDATKALAAEHARNLKIGEEAAGRNRDNLQVEAEGQEAIVQKIKDKQKELTKFSVLDKKSNLKEEFKGEGGTQRAIDQVTKLQESIIKGLEDAKAKVATSVQAKKNIDTLIAKLQSQFAQQNANIVEQLQAQGKIEGLAAAQKQIAEGAKDAAEHAKDFEAQLAKAVGDSSRIVDNLKALGLLLGGTSGQLNFTDLALTGSEGKDLADLISKYNEAAKKAVSPKDFDELQTMLNGIVKKLNEIEAKRASLNPGGVSVFDRKLKPGNPNDPNPDNQVDLTVGRAVTKSFNQIGALRANLELQREIQAKIAQLETDIIRLNKELAASKNILIDLPKKVTEAVDDGISKVEKQAAAATAALGRVAQGLERVDQLKKELPKNIPQSPNRSAPTDLGEEESPAGQARGGLVGHFASGGFLADFFSGKFSRGTDTVPTMLSPGEFVTNSQQTREFLPLLRAINSGKLTPAAAGPSHSTTNIGDININVKGGSTSEATVQDIAQSLRRGLRRGTIKL